MAHIPHSFSCFVFSKASTLNLTILKVSSKFKTSAAYKEQYCPKECPAKNSGKIPFSLVISNAAMLVATIAALEIFGLFNSSWEAFVHFFKRLKLYSEKDLGDFDTYTGKGGIEWMINEKQSLLMTLLE